jgi:membrane protease YdiL (CAAX protease family)
MLAAERWLLRSAASEAIKLWALCFLLIVLAYVTPPTRPYAKLVATAGFLYLPLWAMRRRNEDYREYGVTLRAWRQDLKLFAVLFGLILPLFTLGYLGFAEALTQMPPIVAKLLAPYATHWQFHPRLPARFPEWVVDNLFVVALPEEFFYRGYLQTRLRDAWPEGRLFLGARLGKAFWVTAALFALGHLAIFQVWRLGVFFPALLFGWMRERTGTVMGAALLHACCNLLVLVLEASFF